MGVQVPSGALMKNKPPLKREYSAGGVVYKRETRSGKRKTLWLIGKHSGYHKWVLPKGLIEKGERSWQTAIRETEEEMGAKTRLVEEKPVKKLQYYYFIDKEKVFKTVTFYLLEYLSGNCQKDHDWEMEKVEWFPFSKALKKLAFENEAQVLKEGRKLLGKAESQPKLF